MARQWSRDAIVEELVDHARMFGEFYPSDEECEQIRGRLLAGHLEAIDIARQGDTDESEAAMDELEQAVIGLANRLAAK